LIQKKRISITAYLTLQKLLLFVVFLISISLSYGQSNNFKQNKEFPYLEGDSLYVDSILAQIVTIHKDNLPLAYDLTNQVIYISNAIKYEKGFVKGLRFKIILATNRGYSDTAIYASKQLFKHTKKWKDCKDIANAYYEISQYDSMEVYLDSIINNGAHSASYSTLGSTFNLKGLIDSDRGKLHHAVINFQKAIDYYKLDNNETEVAKGYYNIAGIFEEIGDSSHIKKAEEYMLRSISIFLTDSTSGYLAPAQIGLASFYDNNNQSELAVSILKNTLSNSYTQIPRIDQSQAYLYLSSALFNLNKIDSVLYYIKLSEELAKGYGDYYIDADIELMKAKYYLSKGKFEKAKVHILNSNKVHPDNWDPDYFELIISIADSLDDAPMGNKYLKKYLLIKDSLLNSSTHNQILEMTEKYESEKKEMKINLLQKDILNKELSNKLQSEELSKNKKENQNLLLTISLLTLLIGGIIILALIIRKRKQDSINNLLKEKELESTIHQLKGQDEERARISRELHDGIANDVLALKIKHDGDAEIAAEMKKIHNSIRDLSHQLSETRIVDRNIDSIIRELIKSVLLANNLTVYYLWFPPNDFTKINVQDSKNLYRILQEIFSNIIKHADASNVEINATKHEKTLNLTISDNGKGFDKFSEYKGIGLTNINDRISAMKAIIEIDSNSKSGTTFIINLPIK